MVGNGMESFWMNYYKHHYNQNETQSLILPSALAPPPAPVSAPFEFNAMGAQHSSSSNLKQFFTDNEPKSLDANLALFNPPATLSNATTSGGGMNLTSSIWSDNVNNTEDDVSFYANAGLWEKRLANKVEQSSKVSLVRTPVWLPS